jgi:hypothetical protein
VRRAWPWAGAGLLLLALAAWWAGAMRTVPTPAGAAAERGRGASPAAAAPVDAASRAATLPLDLLLLPDGAVAARADGIRLGLARVPPEAARRWSAWLAGGGEGAGPASYDELAEVQEWRTLSGEALPDGAVRIRADLPAADRYDLQARGDSPLHHYAASFTAAAMPRRLAPIVAAGLRVSGTRAGARVLLRRQAGAETGARWQALLAREAPGLLAAYDEEAWALDDGALLAPLPPGPLEVVLLVEGVEAERRTVTLRAGQTVALRFDAVAQDVAAAVSAALQLEFVQAGSDTPVTGLSVTWHAERGDLRRRSDGAGRVEFAAVDRQRLLRLSLEFPPSPGEALPHWPTARALELSLDDAVPLEAGGTLRKRIELTPLRWLRVSAGAPLQPFHRAGADPYPIFVLQREQAGAWRDAAADSFLSQPDGLAVSLEAAGRYRLMALQSPWSVRWSEAVELRDGDADSPPAVALLPAAGHAVELSVLHQGRPLARAPLHLVGPASRLPPRVVESDAEGRVVLDAVTVPRVTLEVPGYRAQQVDLQGRAALVELQREDALPEG